MVKNGEENEALERLINLVPRERRIKYTFIGMTGRNRFSWFYIDNTPVPLANDGNPGYENWAGGEPNDFGRNEKCGCIRRVTGKWNDIRCEDRLHFICEKGKFNVAHTSKILK